jgi:hypothetical protein
MDHGTKDALLLGGGNHSKVQLYLNCSVQSQTQHPGQPLS